MALQLSIAICAELIKDISPKEHNNTDLKSAAQYLQLVGFATPGDAVGADGKLATDRTIAKRGVGGANALYEAERNPKKMAPNRGTQRSMGLRPGFAKKYVDIHGGATQTHPCGSYVHAGLLRLADRHGPVTPARRALWI